MIDKDLIKKRKNTYGNNFPCIATQWSLQLGITVTPQDVALMMGLMKGCRIDAIVKDIENRGISDDLQNALIDSKMDQENYQWIAHNYDEYLEL